MSNLFPYILTISAVFSIAMGQLLFKTTAGRMGGRPMSEWAVDWNVIVPFGISMFIYAGATLLWIMALRELALSRAYMFMSLSFVIVPILSALIFGEKLTLGYLFGLGLIILGLVITQVLG